jgi:hypothetical protein
MAMASAAMSSNQKRKKKPAPIDTGGEGTMSGDGEFDNPLASMDEAAESRKDFQAAGGELAEYGDGYDQQFSSSQIFQKLETEASVSPLPPPPPAPPRPPRRPPRSSSAAAAPYRMLTRHLDARAETPRKLCANVCADDPQLCR